MFSSEAGVRMVLVATDEEVYSILQEPLNRYLTKNSLEVLTLNAGAMRVSLPRAWDLANCLIELQESGTLKSIAARWLEFERDQIGGKPVLGRDRVKAAIDDLLSPLPQKLAIERVEIAFRVNTGNIIHHEIDDLEEVLEIIRRYYTDPTAILRKIAPRKKQI